VFEIVRGEGGGGCDVNFDFLYTALFWAAGLCIFFWLGLLLAGFAGEFIDDETPSLVRKENRSLTGREKTFY
jgi:hypothetical protein